MGENRSFLDIVGNAHIAVGEGAVDEIVRWGFCNIHFRVRQY